jgi:hypothetical protein
VIHGAGEHSHELLFAHASFDGGQQAFGLGDRRVVLRFGAELEERLCVVDVAPELLERRERRFEVGALPRQRLRFLRVVPETG